jgi:hypothetical protein
LDCYALAAVWILAPETTLITGNITTIDPLTGIRHLGTRLQFH